jgi:hypothetical protein
MNVYQNALEVITPYFNTVNAAEIFLTRQCESHLQRKAVDLGMHDLVTLAKWAMVSGGLLIGKEKAEEMSEKILALRRSMGAVPLRDRLAGGDFTV